MTADSQPGNEPNSDDKGEIRPSPDKNEKLEDRIADEKDDELVSDGGHVNGRAQCIEV